MHIVWLCRYICLVFTLLFAMSMVTSYAPGAENFAFVIQSITGGGAAIAAILAVFLNRFPSDHWVRQSRPLWIAFVLVAVAVTLLMVSVG
jgi:hypothetical protein